VEDSVICIECKSEVHVIHNERCMSCAAVIERKWRERMTTRQNATQFSLDKLIRNLLTQHWMHECRIIPDYMPPFPDKDTRPTCQVFYQYSDGTESGLRYSKGPLQGYFWDVYGDDMLSPELALIAIAKAPPPPRADLLIPTHGR